jgi:thiamine transport system ATP-binding protein
MLTVDELGVTLGETTILDGVNLIVGRGETVGLLGPSGSGKSTLLKAIAGLILPSSGRVLWDGFDLAGVATHRRRFGLMFQGYALFPHLTAAENVGFGLRMQGVDRDEMHRSVDLALNQVGLIGYDDRPIAELSGGEQQRVALARTLAPAPRFVMLDEPLGALDRSLREQLLVRTRTILDTTGVTALVVTHDQEEAVAFSDRLALMRGGTIVQVGTREEILADPIDSWVADFLR